MVHHLAPRGMAGFVLANGSMSSNTSGEGEIRRAMVEADLVDCMIALPGQLFYSTQIPACLWFLARDKSGGNGKTPRRDRRGETLFIDARKLRTMRDRTHRELSDEDIAHLATAYHAWRGEGGTGEYQDIPGLCKAAKPEEIRGHSFVLTPGRYVGAAELDEDDEPFVEKVSRLKTLLEAQFSEGETLEEKIRTNLERIAPG
jgi:type I restriction enzyme M protein